MTDFFKSNLSFSGCGFMCVYHAGVCAALREYASFLCRNKIYGASAGAIAAAGLICNVPVSSATTTILQVVSEARAGTLQAFDPTFDLMSMVRDGLLSLLPDNAHELSLTRYEDMHNVLVSEYNSKEELIQAILCSCFIPVVAGLSIPSFRGIKYLDGGFSDNQPVLDSNTITVSPFSGESDICPLDNDSASILGFVYKSTSMRFTTENFYRFLSTIVPPPQDVCSKICRQGFSDTLRFLMKSSITPCFVCQTIQSNPNLEIPHVHEVRKQARCYIDTNLRKIPISKVSKRRRLDSCENCRTNLEPSDDLFPSALHKMLNEEIHVRPTATSYISYLLSFRIAQFGLKLVKPFFWPIFYAMKPFEYVVFILTCMKQWLLCCTNRNKLIDRILKFVDLILKEIEDRSLLCSAKISCHISSESNSKIQSYSRNQARRQSHNFDEIGCYNMIIGDKNLDSMKCLLEQTEALESTTIKYYFAMPKEIACFRKTEKLYCTVENSSIPILNRSRGIKPFTSRSQIKLLKSSNKDEKLAHHTQSAENLPIKKTYKSVSAEDSGVSLTDDGPSSLNTLRNNGGRTRAQFRDSGISSAIPRFKTATRLPTSSDRRHTVGVDFSTCFHTVRRGHSNLSASSLNNNNFKMGSNVHNRACGKATNNKDNIRVDANVWMSSSDTSDTGGEYENLFIPGRRRQTSRGYDGDREAEEDT